MERTNARYVEALPEPVSLVVVDASFISLRLLLPVFRGWLGVGAHVIVLVKPQFEAGKGQVGKGGVVRETTVHRRVLHDVLEAAQAEGYTVRGLIPSPLKGPAGNIEFLAWLSLGEAHGTPPVDDLVSGAVEQATLYFAGTESEPPVEEPTE
jgi:23S rRNA (cytidine1920-2'-O)/16S rRNA (cytidine1409-2'-O)-methyltransferase